MAHGKRILVAGGAGFLGSHLCERLLNAGNRVICLDSFFSGREINLRALMGRGGFQLIRGDVSEPLDVEVDQIFNLASPASPKDYLANPIFTVKTCVYGSMNLLELAARQNAAILLASTSEIYGDPAISPQREDYWGQVNPIGVRACYNEGKRCAETLCFDYARHHDVRVKVARLFNAYGPRMRLDDGRVAASFIAQALRGEPLTIYGDGSQTRSFCYVDDMIDGMVRLMDSGDELTGPVNLGAPEECAIVDLAKRVLSLTGSSSPLRFLPWRQDDPRQRLPDIARARQTLGWEPAVDLREGLRRTIADFRPRLAPAASTAAS